MLSPVWIDDKLAHRDVAIGGHMTHAPWTISRSGTLAEARRMMFDHDIRHLPVLEAGKLVGVVSQRDIFLVESLPGVASDTVKVDAAMAPEPFQVSSDASVLEVIDQMIDRKLGSVLICEGDEVIGVFTTIDAMRLLAEGLRGQF